VIGKSKPKDNKVRKGEVFKDSAVTILTNGCHFKGKLFCRGSTRIGGRVEGEIVSEGLLIIETDAAIKAGIEGDEIIIQGEVDGRVEAKLRVELCPPSRVTGEIVTSLLVIKEGAQFNGTTIMKPNESNEGDIVDIRTLNDSGPNFRSQEKMKDVVVDLDSVSQHNDTDEVSVSA
jgi:cytoskeletal protein CcmA (bactofilin family)